MSKNLIFRILFVIIVLAICAGLIYFAFLEVMPELIPLLKDGSPAEIEAYLEESSTFKGYLCAALLQMVQVWSIFIAGAPIQIAVGAVYGLWGGFVLCHLSSVFAHFVAITLWKRMGKKLEKWLPMDADKNKSFKEMLNSTTPPMYTVFTACLIPLMPNGMIPFLASKLGIKTKNYIISVFIGSIMSIFLCCACGELIMSGKWITAAIFILVQFVVAILAWVYRHQMTDFIRSLLDRINGKEADTEN